MTGATPSKIPTKQTNTPSTPRTPSVRRRREDNDSEEDTPRKKKEKFGSNVKANNKSLVGRIMESSGDTKPALSSEMEGRGGHYIPNCVSKEENHQENDLLRREHTSLYDGGGQQGGQFKLGEELGEAQGGQLRDELRIEFGPPWTDETFEAPHSAQSDSPRATRNSLQELCSYIFDTIFANL